MSNKTKLLKRLVQLDLRSALSADTPQAHKELWEIITEAKLLFLTTPQKRVFDYAKEVGGWFVLSDIKCQERTIRSLVELGLIEQHWPSGGPYEYRVNS